MYVNISPCARTYISKIDDPSYLWNANCDLYHVRWCTSILNVRFIFAWSRSPVPFLAWSATPNTRQRCVYIASQRRVDGFNQINKMKSPYQLLSRLICNQRFWFITHNEIETELSDTFLFSCELSMWQESQDHSVYGCISNIKNNWIQVSIYMWTIHTCSPYYTHTHIWFECCVCRVVRRLPTVPSRLVTSPEVQLNWVLIPNRGYFIHKNG